MFIENQNNPKNTTSPANLIKPQLPDLKQIVKDINTQKNVIQNITNDESSIEVDSKKEKAKLDRYIQDTQHKNNLAKFVIWFTSIWSAAIIGLLITIGCHNSFHFSDKVIITILTETLVTVLGLPWIVIAHFFPTNKE